MPRPAMRQALPAPRLARFHDFSLSWCLANPAWARVARNDGGGQSPAFAKPGKEEMVLPLAIDLEVAAGEPLFAETGALQQGNGSLIARKAGGFHPVELQVVE